MHSLIEVFWTKNWARVLGIGVFIYIALLIVSPSQLFYLVLLTLILLVAFSEAI